MTVNKATNYTVTIEGTPAEIDAVRYAAQYQQANDTTHTLTDAQADAVVALQDALT